MECIKCGKRLKEGQATCPRCGARQDGRVNLRSLSQATAKKKRPLSKQQLAIRVGVIALAVLLALGVAAIALIYSALDQVQPGSELSGDVGVTEGLSTGVQNIALFGLDTRQRNDKGRSDSMIILSIDRDHNKIKMTSLARDSLVPIDGHGTTKLTNAFVYGGPSLAVKTINKNFGLNITDYAYVNFYEFADIIDYIGGVMIDVDANEKNVMNREYVSWIASYGIPCEKVTQTGLQRLSGGQALAYARNRYTGNDTDRCDRQKEVLEAMYAEVKTLPLSKFPTLIGKVLSQCHTNLTKSEMLSIATWTLSKQPTFERLNIPGDSCHANGGNWQDGKGWVWRYDTQLATAVIYNFIYEAGVDLNQISYTTAPRYTGTTAAHYHDDPDPTTKTTKGTTAPTAPPDVSDPSSDVSDPSDEDPDVSDPDISGGEDPDPDNSTPDDPDISDPNNSTIPAESGTDTPPDEDA